MVSVHYMPARYPSAHPLPPLSVASHSRGIYWVFGTLTTILGVGKGKRAYCCNGEGEAGSRVVLVLPMLQFAFLKSVFASLGGQRERAPKVRRKIPVDRVLSLSLAPNITRATAT